MDEPIDLQLVQLADDLIISIASGRGDLDNEDRLAAILAAWRAEVYSDPIPELISIDAALTVIRASTAADPTTEGHSRGSSWLHRAVSHQIASTFTRWRRHQSARNIIPEVPGTVLALLSSAIFLALTDSIIASTAVAIAAVAALATTNLLHARHRRRRIREFSFSQIEDMQLRLLASEFQEDANRAALALSNTENSLE